MWPTPAAWARVAATGFSKVAASFLTGTPGRFRACVPGPVPTAAAPPDASVEAAAGGRGQQREPVVLEAGWGGKRPPPRLPRPPLPRAPLPSAGRRAGTPSPTPGRWGGGWRAPLPPGRPALLAPRGGSFQEELRARRTAGRTDTLSSSSTRPESGGLSGTARAGPGGNPEEIGNGGRNGDTGGRRGVRAHFPFRWGGGNVRGWHNEFRPRARARPLE